jgi:hypothetical protein
MAALNVTLASPAPPHTTDRAAGSEPSDEIPASSSFARSAMRLAFTIAAIIGLAALFASQLHTAAH